MDSTQKSAPSQTIVIPNPDEFLTYSQLPEPPADEWLIDGLIQAQTFVVLYGPPGRGKTFLAVSAALSVATGMTFLGRKAKKMTVMFVAAEDGARVKRRFDGWLQDRGLLPPANVFYRLNAPNFFDKPATDRFCDKIKRVSDRVGLPGLIVLDNLARCMAVIGASDSDSGTTGEVMSNIDEVKNKTGAGFLLVHHTNKQGEVERGSVNIRAIPDCMIMADGTSLKCTKQRNEAEFPPVGYALRRVTLPDGHSTCVPEWVPGMTSGPRLSENQRKILDALKDCPSGKKFSQIWKDTGLPKATFADVLKRLSKGEESEISFSDGLYSLRSNPTAPDGGGRSGKPPLGGFPTDRPTVVVVEPEKNLRPASDRPTDGRTETDRADQPPTDQDDPDYDPDDVTFADFSDDDGVPLEEPPGDLPEVEVDDQAYDEPPTPEEMMDALVWSRKDENDDLERGSHEAVAKAGMAEDDGF